jgi:AraC-like DNA-binding protein
MEISLINQENLAKVKKYIINNPNKRTRLAKLTSMFGINRSYLMIGFKTIYGITIHHFQLRKSMEYALSELQKGERIKVMAIKLGYMYPGSFTRAFIKIHGVAPQKYEIIKGR